MKTATLRLIAIVLLLLTQVAPAPAQRSRENLRSNDKILDAFKDAVSAPARSVVRVQVDGKDVSLGTVVAANGYILTRAEDLDGKIVCKFSGGKTLDAAIVGVDEPNDLAMLKVDAKDLTPVEWKSSKKAEPGDWVAAPGLGSTPVAIGVVSVVARKVNVRSIPTTPSGKGGFLGIGLADVEDGVKVGTVQDGGAAAKAGIKPDDVILSINGKAIPDPNALRGTLGKMKPGDEVTIKVKRGDDEKELTATLGKWPKNIFGGMDMNSLGSELSERRAFPNILQHDAVLKPLDCGGPLVELDGKAVGINISRAGRTESYAIPSDTVVSLLDDLKSGKLAPKKEKETPKE